MHQMALYQQVSCRCYDACSCCRFETELSDYEVLI